jgi:hypothetical protein
VRLAGEKQSKRKQGGKKRYDEESSKPNGEEEKVRADQAKEWQMVAEPLFYDVCKTLGTEIDRAMRSIPKRIYMK